MSLGLDLWALEPLVTGSRARILLSNEILSSVDQCTVQSPICLTIDTPRLPIRHLVEAILPTLVQMLDYWYGVFGYRGRDSYWEREINCPHLDATTNLGPTHEWQMGQEAKSKFTTSFNFSQRLMMSAQMMLYPRRYSCLINLID